jgi:hypothetical protein
MSVGYITELYLEDKPAMALHMKTSSARKQESLAI